MHAHGLPVPPLSYAPARPAEVRTTRASPAKAAARLDWRPEVELADGLARTYAAFARPRALSGG
ncbi:hypothetical protein CKO28_18990 [Rhodovibrio sodomensis]|uniref:NAD(P)-binding domain-containing protein n=1 Tax=Rhodovibrio sodomensis TaxID=1088 RepID=A0ABS1DI23_9PROT|nr:hypothetical protein [Rhodovibrio sodomensis]